MKILVPTKRVVDPSNANKVKLSADARAVTSDGLEWKMNPYDEYALEAALRLNENGATKETFGEIVLVSIGPKDAVATLRGGLAMGAQRAILVEQDEANLDAMTVARALKAVVEKEKPDLVLMGKMNVDAETNAVGGMLAELLGWPCVSLAMSIETQDQGKTLTIGRELDTGVLTVTVKTPCIVTASDRMIQPTAVKNGVTPADFAYPQADGGRYAPLKGIMAAKKKPVDETSLAALGVTQATPAAEYTKFTMPPARKGSTTFVASAAELVQKLRGEAKVL